MQVKIVVPMSEWADYIQGVFFNLKRPNLETYILPDDCPEVLEAQQLWTSRPDELKTDFEGESWPLCFTHHKCAREKILRVFAIDPPSVSTLRAQLAGQATVQLPAPSNQFQSFQRSEFNWTEHLLAREADVLGLHLPSYLF